MFDINLYNDEFFAWHHKYTREYQTNTFQWYIDKYKPTSVIDFGCGIGTYLETALKNGIKELCGLDIGVEYAWKYTPEEVRPFIQYTDCAKGFYTWYKYNTVLSFETAEHIDPAGSETFVENIVNACNGKILFTAAPPGQEGCGHINLQPREYWIYLFQSFGAMYAPDLTKEIAEGWETVGCPSYISNNLITFLYSPTVQISTLKQMQKQHQPRYE